MRWLLLILAVLLAGNCQTGDSTITTTQASTSDGKFTNLRVNGNLSIGGHFGRDNIWTRWAINDIIPQSADTFFSLTSRKLSQPCLARDSSRHVHPGIVYFPEGFPRASDSVSPHKFILVTTPLINSESEENPTIHFSNDITVPNSWTTKYGPNADDTLRNPIDTIGDAKFTEDVVYYYHNGSNKAYYDTTGTGVDSQKTNQPASYLSDPGLLQTADGKLCMFYRATWNRANLPMSAIYARTSTDGVTWGTAHRITQFGRWKSPAIVLDTGSLYVMFVSTDIDSVTGRKTADSLYRFTSKTLDTFFTFQGPCSTTIYPNHLSAWAPAYDQMFLVVKTNSQAFTIWESRNHGWNWTKGDSILIKGGPAGEWDEIGYQASIFGIDEGSHMTIGCVFSSYYDSSSAIIFHTGYKEIPMRPMPRTPAPTSWVKELSSGNILGVKRTDDLVRCVVPYFSGTDRATFMDTCISGSNDADTVVASYTFEDHVLLDSIKFYGYAATTVVDSFAIIIPKTGAVFADSIHASSNGTDFTPSISWSGTHYAINNAFTAGQEISFKWIIKHTEAGNYMKIKRIILCGRRYYD